MADLCEHHDGGGQVKTSPPEAPELVVMHNWL